jgi:vacuolar iron transporter family protein
MFFLFENQLADRFESKGMARKDAEMIVEKMAQYENFFVNMVVSEEVGIQIPEEETDSSLFRDAFIMFWSFCAFGLVALSPFLLIAGDIIEQDQLLVVVSGWCLLLLTLLGASKSSFNNAATTTTVLEALATGITCAVLAYFVGLGAIILLEDY